MSTTGSHKPVCNAVLASLVTNIDVPGEGKINWEYFALILVNFTNTSNTTNNFTWRLIFRRSAEYQDNEVSPVMKYRSVILDFVQKNMML